jgi:hypothetical protein
MHIAPRFLFQAVQGKPANLVRNSQVESPGFICIFKSAKSPTAARLRAGHPMKLFAFDRNPSQARTSFAWHEAHRKALVTYLSIHLISAHPLG